MSQKLSLLRELLDRSFIKETDVFTDHELCSIYSKRIEEFGEESEDDEDEKNCKLLYMLESN